MISGVVQINLICLLAIFRISPTPEFIEMGATKNAEGRGASSETTSVGSVRACRAIVIGDKSVGAQASDN